MSAPQDFSALVVRWQRTHGRNHLPWQATREPYPVWLSEIMLQQTQVATVLGYFERFMQRFPDVRALAAASQDEVLALWSGLGYYSRARNLHRCAQIVVAQHGGAFPRSAQELAQLPGIGRSTAAAIAAFCFGERVAILDANVRRVLTRVLGFDADLAQAVNERALWLQADALLPHQQLAETMPRYTQGLMDLGAGICLPRAPRCTQCPVQALCVAYRQGEPERYPVRTRKLKRSVQSWWLLLRRDGAGRIWLQRRPDSGIWAGLYCPPVFDDRQALLVALGEQELTARAQDLPAFVHVLTHRDLHLHPVLVSDGPCGVTEPHAPLYGEHAGDGEGWFDAEQWPVLGLPAAVRRLLERIA